MPIAQNPDGTLWVNINDLSEVDGVQAKLLELGVRVTTLIPDPTCGVVVTEVDWTDVYPKIVPRNGPEPGIVVDPGEIPEGQALVVAAGTMTGPGRDPETVMMLYLIDGPPPDRVAKIVGHRALPPPPGFRRPKPGSGKFGKP